MELSDFPRVFQLISGRAEIQPRSTQHQSQAFSTMLHLDLTFLKQLSHWKLKLPPASTWHGTIKDLTAKILIQPSTVPFACSPHNYVRGRYYHLRFTERKTGTQNPYSFPMILKFRAGLKTWHLAILSSDLHSLGPQPLNKKGHFCFTW